VDEQCSFTAELFGMVLVVAILVAITVLAIEPMSKQLAVFASQSLVSHPRCESASQNNPANLVCLLRR
jgi:hypothetical protein